MLKSQLSFALIQVIENKPSTFLITCVPKAFKAEPAVSAVGHCLDEKVIPHYRRSR